MNKQMLYICKIGIIQPKKTRIPLFPINWIPVKNFVKNNRPYVEKQILHDLIYIWYLKLFIP